MDLDSQSVVLSLVDGDGDRKIMQQTGPDLISSDSNHTNNEENHQDCTNGTKTKVPSPKTILDLPDEILLIILQLFQSANDLLSVRKVNSRFQKLASTPCLWNSVTIEWDHFESLQEMLERTHAQTDKIKIFGNVHGDNSGGGNSFLPVSLLLKIPIKAPFLTHLHLRRQRIDGHNYSITMFPKTLKVLDLSESFLNVKKYVVVPNDEQPCDIEDAISYFKGIGGHLRYLEELRLDYCNWIVPYDLIHIRQLELLRILSIRGVSFKLSKFIPPCFRPVPSIERNIWRRVRNYLIHSTNSFEYLQALDITNSTLIDYGHIGIVPAMLSKSENSIEELYLGSYDELNFWNRNFVDLRLQILEFIPRLPKLRVIDVTGIPMKKEELSMIENVIGLSSDEVEHE